ncbi:MAG: hypothetical protein KY459_02540 [Acidobacteria bacterium]|nr:hypothetical protein [Acidobacteriota bacterium]
MSADATTGHPILSANLATAGVIAAAALVVVRSRAGTTPVDLLLPLLILVVGVFGSRRLSFPVTGALSLLALGAWIIAGDDTVRALIVGGAWSAMILWLVIVSDHRVETAVLVATGMAPFRLLGAAGVADVVSGLVVLAGAAGFVLAWPHDRGRLLAPREGVAFALLLAAVTPAFPLRASLIPLFAALLMFGIRQSGRRRVVIEIAALAAGIVIGLWAALLAAVLVLGVRAGAGRRPAFTGAPIVLLSPLASLASGWWTLLPFVAGTIRTRKLTLWIPLAAGVGIALISRPSVALASVILGGALAAGGTAAVRDHGEESTSLPLVVLAAIAVSLFPWSGAVMAGFPFNSSTAITLATAAILYAPLFGRLSAVAIPVILGAGLFLLGSSHYAGGSSFATLRAGERLSFISGEAGADRVIVELSAENASDRPAGTALGSIDVVGEDGGVVRHEVAIGDVADWGAFRSTAWYRTLNVPPRIASGPVTGWGIDAFRRGTGRMILRGAGAVKLVSIGASSELDPDEGLIIEGVRFE